MASAIFSFSSSRVSPWEMASGICSHCPVYQPFAFFWMMIVYSILFNTNCLCKNRNYFFTQPVGANNYSLLRPSARCKGEKTGATALAAPVILHFSLFILHCSVSHTADGIAVALARLGRNQFLVIEIQWDMVSEIAAIFVGTLSSSPKVTSIAWSGK